jgi:putative nucleotidyltransferase with HDIG domain
MSERSAVPGAEPAGTGPGEEPLSAEAILSRVDNLPTIPLLALKVGELVNDPRASARDIAQVMESDPSLSAKVLRLVNSPYYGIPGGVTDVQRAISFIGFNTLHQLVLSVAVLDSLRTPAGAAFNARGLWTHSLAVAVCAESIARHVQHRDPGSCFTAGLLHDVGKIALAIAAPERFGAALDDAQRNGIPMARAEHAAGLPSHDKVGSRLARRWKFPAPLLVPIETHHTIELPEARSKLAPSLVAVADIVNAADHICRFYGIGDSGSPPPERSALRSLERLGIGMSQVERIHGTTMRQLEASKIFLELVDAGD